MAITYAGSLPCSSVNLGLAASGSAFAHASAQLTSDLSKLGASFEAQATFTANFPPNIAAYLAGFAETLTPAALLAAFNPLNWITLNADANLELAAELGLVELKIAAVGTATATLQAGVNAGGLTGWSYAGQARGFGTTLAEATQYGFGAAGPTDEVNALIIACAEFGAWVSFSASFNTGPSALEDLGSATTEQKLSCLGTLTGGQWNTGALDLLARLDLFLLELNGLKVALEAEIALTLGVDLPEPAVILELEVDLDLALEVMVDVQLDITAQIGVVDLQLDVVLDLIAEIDAQLAVDGLHVWTYSGPAGELGSTFAGEVATGLPGGGGALAPIYGVAIACASPSAWAAFGNICLIS